MARHRSTRSDLYHLARLIGDAQAAQHGPTGLAKRYARKRAYRASGSLTAMLLRLLGLQGR